MFAAASNPCKCGYYGDPEKVCRCSARELDSYRSKLSGPLAERIDMCVELPRIDYNGLTEGRSQSSEEMRERINQTVYIQNERFRGTEVRRNGEMTESMVEYFCCIESGASEMLERAYAKYSLSPRRYFKILKLARTIADLNREELISSRSLLAAIGYIKKLDLYNRDETD